MASALKRKRAPVDVLETPKRAKSTKSQPTNLLWKPNAAFIPPSTEKLAQSNGVNGDGKSSSPEAVDFEAFMKKDDKASEERRNSIDTRVKKIAQLTTDDEFGGSQSAGKTPQRKDSSRALEKAASKVTKKKANGVWKLSEPIGGHLVNADPVFTADEKFIIIANRNTIQVYSTSNSLLTRSIKLKLSTSTTSSPRIVAFSLSPSRLNILWVACSDGNIFSIDWTTGLGGDQSWCIASAGCVHMTVASMESSGRRRDVVFLTDIRNGDGAYRVTANELHSPESGIPNDARTIYTSTEPISLMRTAREGSILVGSSGKRLIVGRLKSTEYNTMKHIRYEFRMVESTEVIKSLDLRVTNRSAEEAEGLKKSLKKTPVVDVVVGDVRGVLYLHNDVQLKLFNQSSDGTLSSGLGLTPRKLHWHRQAVHTVKWSLDGNYIISGGTETVLVLWQLDTGKHQFLPHMSATIQNVVVSPTGTSYAVHLADNSAMVLSIAELKPTANISGVQIAVITPEAPLESQIKRVEPTSWSKPLVQRTPAAINPARPSLLLLGVGQSQEINASKPQKMSNPYLATYDVGTAHNLSRQTLARTNVTNVDAAASTYCLTEPRVTHIKLSHDGQWLATVDEWTPPEGDVDYLKHGNKSLLEEQRHRREVFLKFWQWSEQSEDWELVSRINAPHTVGEESSDAGRVLGLAVDPSSLRFSTIGEDGIVRTWIPRTRKRDGVVVRDKERRPMRDWSCQHAVLLGKLELLESTATKENIPSTGLVAFSEDGSLLAAACGNEDGLLHIINPDSGFIFTSHTGLFENEIFGLQFLREDLIVLSENLLVFDLVSQEMRYGVKLNHSVTSLSTEQKHEMMHLTADERSKTFAVALPRFSDPLVKNAQQNLWQATSELIVFSQDSPEPQLKEVFPTVISALIPAVSTEGYVVLDALAEIHVVLKKGDQAPTILAQSTSALQLDSISEEPAESLMQFVEVTEDNDEPVQLSNPVSNQITKPDDDSETPVVTQQQVDQIFDIGPAFALPSAEEMLSQVAALFLSKPIMQSSS